MLRGQTLSWQVLGSGLRVPQFGDAKLCSSVDPVQEGRQWVSRFTADLNQTKLFAVIGLGAGFHAIELSKAHPESEIIIFESEKALIESFQFSMERYQNLNVVHFKSIELMVQQPYFETLARDHSPVLSFNPALRHWSPLAQELHRFLLGHTPKGLAARLNVLGLVEAYQNFISEIPDSQFQMRSAIEVLSAIEMKTADGGEWSILRELTR